MSTTATVPMIGPDGSSADIPHERVSDALASGGKLAVVMTAPDGTLAYIPHENAAAAIKAGGKIGQPSAQEGYQAPAIAQQPSGPSPGQELGDTIGQIAGAVGDQLKETGKTVYSMVRHPIDTSPLGLMYGTAKFEAEHADSPATSSERLQQYGVDLPGAKQAYSEGNIPSAIQKVVNPLAQAVILKKAGEVAGKLAPKIADTPSPRAAYEAARAKPQMMTMEQMKQMSPREVSGLEDIYRASAPTGKNPGFRDNLNAALPDLRKVAAAIDLSESKGGIISPDMRVRATVKAINSQLENMYQTERVPQIEATARVPVRIKTSADAVAGLEYLSKSAGLAEERAMAASALRNGTVSMQVADELAKVSNQYLKTFERMTPEQQTAALNSNPKIGGLKALDVGLGKEMNIKLRQNGQAGIEGYERRYAGLSAVRDALQDRMNAAELDQPGIVKGLIRPAIGALTKGKTGIASASQAAVADIRIGKALQSGFEKLKSGPSPSGRR